MSAEAETSKGDNETTSPTGVAADGSSAGEGRGALAVCAVPFLICDVCRHATELCDERVTDLLLEQARAHGFLAEAQTLEVHGVCRRCRDGHATR